MKRAGKYEGSKADKAHDKMEARKHKMPLKKWESSPMDAKMDRAGQRAMDRKKRR